jgi:GTP-binding protein
MAGRALVDRLLQRSGAFRDNQRVANGSWIQRTTLNASAASAILAKATSVVWKDVRINIVDTPGTPISAARSSAFVYSRRGDHLVDAAEG